MTPNGPSAGQEQPWSGHGSEAAYGEPADPWGDQPEPWRDAATGYGGALPDGPTLSNHADGAATTQAAGPVGGGAWVPAVPLEPGEPAAHRPGGPIVALVVVLGLLVCAAAATTAYLLREPAGQKGAAAQTSASARPAESTAPAPTGTGDARLVEKGQCIRNEGTDEAPQMRITPCARGTFEVLKRVNGRTTGEPDAESKCAKVRDYSLWYFYDSELDALDFVLCLKRR